MSTATARFDEPLSPRAADHARDHRPSLARLTRVELRKMYDTRAGFWLLLSGLLLTVLTVVLVVVTGQASDHTLSNVLDNSVQALNVLLPIVGILLVTSEWSQRTALLTFTLVPQRGRVLAAKVSASIVLALVAFLAALALSAVGTALNPSGLDGTWSIDAGVLAQTALFTVISMLIGVALGAAILVSAPAIVASFVLPLAFSAVTHLIGGLDGMATWLDQGETLTALTDHSLSAHEWGHIGTTALLWLVLPLAVGTWRFRRGEIR
jgi:ABC-type transport system involved in multi-copper enzyme maturation permease subunit